MRQTVEENREWIQFILIIMTIGSFMLMARADYHHLDSKIEAIQQEIKDFHGRLCAIEERRGK